MTKELLAEFPPLPRTSYYEGHAYNADQMRDYALTLGEWLQKSSYRAGAKAGYNLGVDENHQGLARLLSAHEYLKPAAQAEPANVKAVLKLVDTYLIESKSGDLTGGELKRLYATMQNAIRTLAT